MSRPVTAVRAALRPERFALVLLYLCTVSALVGYATFGLHPALLVGRPEAAAFYAIAFDLFAQLQIWVAWAALVVYLSLRAGWRWLPAFAAVYLISLGSELMGTTSGIPFGEYRYTEALGAKWLGHVPIVIPLSWFFMALPSYALARAALPGAGRGAARVLLGSLLLLSWDLSLDPAMSHATAYWVWSEPGTYYGMPWLNLFGWYVTGLALMAALALLRSDRWVEGLSLRWLAAFYLGNLLLPLGMSVAAGLWGAVAATLGAAGVALVVGRELSGRRSKLSRPVAEVAA
jgi:uncharacterized membrane protein